MGHAVREISKVIRNKRDLRHIHVKKPPKMGYLSTDTRRQKQVQLSICPGTRDMGKRENAQNIKGPGINSPAVYSVHFSSLYGGKAETGAVVKSKMVYVQLCVLLVTDMYHCYQ
jgi:hypothetical protein